ncbi:DsbC family protein [Rhodoferax sp.]|uniref:DsbC family protein n=1 Tax=Rhodoferax sp. TaxID=50421 RepID=UPI002725B5A2|nr:DsbC family protein [Rhodoferax sp.]MDO9197737.1 DsbC family protein [Rhodoferax sp.]
MKFKKLAFPLAASLVLALGGCSPQDAADKTTTATKPAQPYEAVASQGKGFTVGSMMSAQAVYVLFDPQCPHCGHLWEASVPLHSKVKFVWIPVAIMNAKSATQGAALLSAANPAEMMTAHEKSILAGTGGIAASASVPADLEAAIKKNTQLFTSLGIESVPYILARNIRSGQVVTNNGAMATPALAEFLGIAPP